jgi:hypothetical protein
LPDEPAAWIGAYFILTVQSDLTTVVASPSGLAGVTISIRIPVAGTGPAVVTKVGPAVPANTTVRVRIPVSRAGSTVIVLIDPVGSTHSAVLVFVPVVRATGAFFTFPVVQAQAGRIPALDMGTQARIDHLSGLAARVKPADLSPRSGLGPAGLFMLENTFLLAIVAAASDKKHHHGQQSDGNSHRLDSI